MISLLCPDCPGVMTLDPASSFFKCASCNAVHKAHPNGDPTGYPADKETRKARFDAHKAFEPIEMIMGKDKAYQWLSERVGNPHMAKMSFAQCRQVIKICEHVTSFLKFYNMARP